MKKILIFDFDGVIIDTATIKTEAFYKLFRKYGKDVATKAKNFHIQNEGISRFEKFEYIITKIMKRNKFSLPKDSLDKLYSNIVLDKIKKKKITYGFLKFIKNTDSKFKFYISSSSPDYELKDIIINKKINNFFEFISGYPPNKITQIKKIIQYKKLKSEYITYIGDTEHDLKVAETLNLSFIGFIKFGNKFKSKNINLISNFKEIIPTINKRN